MPELSRFLGIIIAMYYRDHAPPHFHAIYAEFEATIGIESGEVSGYLPKRALGHVQEWQLLHKEELLNSWARSSADATAEDCASGVNVMLTRIVEARFVSDFTIWLRFSDGVEGEVDLRAYLTGPIFEPLRAIETFRNFRLDPELKTLVWPNGADLAPEFLREKLRVAA